MSTSSIGVGFSITKFPINQNFDVRINSREEFNFLRYSSRFNGANVGVSFLDSDPITVDENIIIQDLTDQIPENSPRKYFELIENSQTFTLPTGDFNITDVFKTTSNGDVVPLYLRHDLSQHSNISEVEIIDSNMNPVNKDLYHYYDESATLGMPSKFIYTNIENSYDRTLNEYTIYYYRYRDTSTGRLVFGLLDAQAFYTEAEFSVPSTVRSYRIDHGNELSEVQVFFNSRIYSPTPLPSSQRFSVRAAGSDRISVIAPLDLPASQRWYPRITLGQFYRNVAPGERNFYHVPEYYNQFFSPVPPYKSLVEKQAKILDDQLIHIAPAPIANLGITGFYLYIVLKDSMGRAVRAFTNDSNSSVYITPNKVITEILYEHDMIQSIDSGHGFIRLADKIDTSLQCYITYRYKEPHYIYRDVNINSTINPSILNTGLLFYVIPEGATPNTRSIHHIQFDDTGNIIDSSQNSSYIFHSGVNTGSGLNTVSDPTLADEDIYSGFELEILTGDNSGRKIKIDSYDILNKTLLLEQSLTHPLQDGIKYKINKKIESYSHDDVESNTTFHYVGWKDAHTVAPYYYVLLGNTFAVQTLAPRDIDYVDIRVRGGGVRKDQLESALGLQDEVQWYWDVGYWDGQAYPGMGAVIVEIPRTSLVESGGVFTRAQIEDIVRRHVAEGTYPIIRYYDRSTLITNVEPDDQSVYLEWQDVEASAYNVYVGLQPDLMRLYRTVAGAITELTVEDLDNDKTYYFKVESVINGYPQLPSKTIMAIPYNASTVLPGATYGITIYNEGTYQNG